MPREISTVSTYLVYTTAAELATEDSTLFDKAKKACTTSYAPYSNFNVGAALRLANGEIVCGSNQENAAYPSGLCAERVAIFAAGAKYPGITIESIAVAAYKQADKQFVAVTPCGSCRQVLLEYEFRQNSPFTVILPWQDNQILISGSVAQLLPLSFNPSSL